MRARKSRQMLTWPDIHRLTLFRVTPRDQSCVRKELASSELPKVFSLPVLQGWGFLELHGRLGLWEQGSCLWTWLHALATPEVSFKSSRFHFPHPTLQPYWIKIFEGQRNRDFTENPNWLLLSPLLLNQCSLISSWDVRSETMSARYPHWPAIQAPWIVAESKVTRNWWRLLLFMLLITDVGRQHDTCLLNAIEANYSFIHLSSVHWCELAL